MAQELSNQWGTDTGLVSEFDGDCVEAWFATNEQSEYDPDRVFLWLRFINITTEEDDTLDEVVQRLSIGKGWEIADGGKRVVRSDGNERKGFNENTALGKLSDRVTGSKKEGVKFGAYFTDLLAHFAESGASPRDATIWEGHRFHVGPSEYPIKDRDTGEMSSYTVVLPEKYLGAAVIGNGVAQTKLSTNGDGPGDLLDTLAQLAQTAETHAAFQAAALQVEGVATDQTVLNRVVDDSDAGIYAQARA